MIFAVFDPSPLTVCTINCSFFTYIFAVLLPDLSRLSCHSVHWKMFLNMNTRHQAHKPVKECNYWGPIFETEWSTASNCVSVPNFEAIAPTVAEIWRYFNFSRWRPPPSWIFKFLKFLTVGRLKSAELHRHDKFDRNRWNRSRDKATHYTECRT